MGTVSQLTRARAVQWARQFIDRLDARLLLQFVCGCTANALIADPDVVLDEAQDRRVVLATHLDLRGRNAKA